MKANQEPCLAAPGAGLPALELLIGQSLFALKRLCGGRKTFRAGFCEERARIRHLVESCGEADREKRVLIARLRGLEDSSRHWSVWMTLDHLRITNEAFARIIRDLTQGIMPGGKASTAAVKPSSSVTTAIEAAYESSCDELLATVDTAANLKTRLRYAHPWFGPLNASGWQALAGMHMGIHRAQIESIIAGGRE